MSSNRSSTDRIFNSKQELLDTANSYLGVPFGKLDKNNRLKSKKGGIGQLVEEEVFEYSVNSSPEPDFSNLGIELKVSALIKNSNNSYRAKERMVLNIINYMKENLKDFEKSSFWHKNKEILMMFYEYNPKIPREKWFLQEMLDFEWPEKDLLIVKQDWKKIVNKIKKGKAHELSESDTTYLGACTKGSKTEKNYVSQPFSTTKAKRRAYSLKQSYVNYILKNYVFGKGKKHNEELIKDSNLLKNKSFENVILNVLNPYIGLTQKQITSKFNIGESKQTNASIIKKIFKINGDLNNTEEFQKANIIAKTIRLEKNGKIKECMSFPAFEFKEIIKQTWEESDFYSILSTSTFLFIVFQRVDEEDANSYLKKAFFWRMNEEDIKEARKVWENTKIIVKRGVNITPSKKGFTNDLPKKSENRVAHVRPHSEKRYYKFGDDFIIGNQNDGDELPDGRWMTKQAFWLNNTYIKSIIEEEEK